MKNSSSLSVIISLSLIVVALGCEPQKSAPYTHYTNPVVWADMPDLSVTRCGDDFYLISTTMHMMPGAPVMRSKDLVHWNTVSYVFDTLNDHPGYDLMDRTAYGRGQWASSIRYHRGKYYVLFSPNDQPYSAYIYSTDDPTDKWELVSRTQHFHDPSLFFDDDGRVFVFYDTGKLAELKSDLSGVKEDGVNMKIFERDETETGLLEGSQVIKHNGKYYLLMISWPQNQPRRQVCYRADNITGPYEKKVILEDNFAGFPYCGQGCMIDDKNGNWYGLIFQDRGGVGRVPLLMPVRWEEEWPILGNQEGKVPLTGEIPLKKHDTGWRITESDDFDRAELKNNWQWNHNPMNEYWSLSERPGYLRLKTNRVVPNLYAAPNTITQRMEGPRCSGVVCLDMNAMKEGDVAGLAAFNGHSGILAVVKENGKKILKMTSNIVHLSDEDKAIVGVDEEELQRIELSQERIYLRIDADFNLNKDMATFYYSIDNENWIKMGQPYKMRFDYRKLFMGTRFAIFNYATRETGGLVDFDFFEYERFNEETR
ncbi:glycoside hydrolase 43 family protein [Proteiniphilum sp. X52]|uniref:glycoside hydrolase family 43 protein n=1 Tax=Proteiniphilum sp. X52 TaxID=2382159 RepID=UPI000F09EC97|nr:glycoside hydrolase 43 family protein [Proteiniphilum sp. X52]RNC65585.1 glycoside hydrolase [Proteiniphilum sp. X52]